jgi:hypothetical protein
VDNRYLIQQRRGWYAVVEVPRSLRDRLGRRLKRTLKTTDVNVARARRHRVVADLMDAIKSASRETQGDPLQQEAAAFREALADPERLDRGHYNDVPDDDIQALDRAIDTAPSTQLKASLTARAYEIEARHDTPTAQAFYDLATGKTTPLATYVPQWLADGTLRGVPLKERTQDERRSAVEKLGAWLGQNRLPVTIEAVTRKVAGRYVSEALLSTGRDTATVAKLVQFVRQYWAWLIRRGHLPDGSNNPWQGQAPTRAARNTGGLDAERPLMDVRRSHCCWRHRLPRR